MAKRGKRDDDTRMARDELRHFNPLLNSVGRNGRPLAHSTIRDYLPILKLKILRTIINNNVDFHIVSCAKSVFAKSPNNIKIYLNGDINDEFYLVNARVLLGVKLHYNDNEKATSMRKQFRVRSS